MIFAKYESYSGMSQDLVGYLAVEVVGYQAYSEHEMDAIERGDLKKFGDEMVRDTIYELLAYDCERESNIVLNLLLKHLTA